MRLFQPLLDFKVVGPQRMTEPVFFKAPSKDKAMKKGSQIARRNKWHSFTVSRA